MQKLLLRLLLYSIICFFIRTVICFCIEPTVLATIFVGFEAAFIGLTQLRNTRDQLEVSLFMQFNEKYSKLNDEIKKYLDKEDKNALAEEETCTKNGINKEKVLEDYINLCCEEYYCYRVKKQIPFCIWKFWHAGIMYNWNHCKELQKLWINEYSNANSFYISDGDHPFKIEAIRKNKTALGYCFEKIENFFF